MLHVGSRIRCRAVSVAVVLALAAVPIASGVGDRGSGVLVLHAELNAAGLLQPCPPDAPPEADFCTHRTGTARVPGLGLVIQSYMVFADFAGSPSCGGMRVLRASGQLTVVGKGTFELDLAPLDQCFPDLLRPMDQPFTITGGTGAYAGATGGGDVLHDVRLDTIQGTVGTDTWSGSLAVPGHEFDLTPPALKGLVTKTVHARKGAKRVRVTYRVTAQDLVDRSISAACKPRSGSRFRLGRTVVRCSVTDSSANTAMGSFRVIVKRRR
jgi:hypothetical protein